MEFEFKSLRKSNVFADDLRLLQNNTPSSLCLCRWDADLERKSGLPFLAISTHAIEANKEIKTAGFSFLI